MVQHLPLIFKNSIRNKRRSILTLFSIAASLCLLGLLMAIYHSFYFSEASQEQSLRLIVRNKVSLANPLLLSYLSKIRQVQGVEEAMINQWFGGTYKDNTPKNFFARFAVEPARLFTMYTEFKMSEEEKKAFVAERSSCVIGEKLAATHNFKLGDRIALVGDIFPVKLELIVRGIFHSDSNSEILFFHYDYLNESLGTGRRDSVGTFLVRMDRPENAKAISKAIDDQFRNAMFQTKTETEKAFELSFLAFLGNVKAFLISICAAVTFTILLVTGNTMAMSVRERVREVGVLKTLGYTPGLILSLLVGESLVISLLGGVLGLGLAALLCSLLRSMPSTFADMSRINIVPPIAAIGMGVALAVGLVSSLIPAFNASRKPILEALRMND
jgi:putative ABC transport system permease protein